MLATAKITSKNQTTVPRAVRLALAVGPGDVLAWEFDADGTAVVRRASPLDLEYLRGLESTLSEWAGAADEEAYRDF